MRRYRLILENGLVEEVPSGEWVEYEDVEKVMAENKDLTAKNKRLIQIMNEEGKKEGVEDGG